MSPAKAGGLAALLLTWFRANARDLPWRRTRDPYAIWVSEVMLQQTQVKTVVPYWERWMRKFPTIEALAAAKAERVLKLWEGLGYYSRARNLHRAARVVVSAARPRRSFGLDRQKTATQRLPDESGVPGCRFPSDYDSILALPGVGRYTAGAICSIAFNQPKPVLDGNVIRVLTRLFGISALVRETAVRDQLWKKSQALVLAASGLTDPDASNCSHLNQALMELGATVCTPRRPECSECPWLKTCVACHSGQQECFPRRGPRSITIPRSFHAFVLTRRGRVLLRQRPGKSVNASLWEFPNVEAASWQDAAKDLGFALSDVEPVCEIRHSITRFRITLHVWRPRANPVPLSMIGGNWIEPGKARRLPFTSAHRKVIERLASSTSGSSRTR